MNNGHLIRGVDCTYMAKTLNWISLTLFPSCRNDKEIKNEIKVVAKSRLKIYSGDLHRAVLFR